MKRRFYTLDVFTRESLAGNPLAVVLDSDGLDTFSMQKIAAEFNLSETVFVLAPEGKGNRARVRIFTPRHELPFAGHPTVGTAVLLASLDILSDSAELVLEENVGPVSCRVRQDERGKLARFSLPKIPHKVPWKFDAGLLADALSVSENDLGFENHEVAVWNGGLHYVVVPVRDLEVVQGMLVDTAMLARLNRTFDGELADVYVYCRGGESGLADFHARMFAPAHGIPEDPATGSAVASLCGQLAALEMAEEEDRNFLIEQGCEMGRPSQIHLDISKEHGTIREAGIEGGAVIVCEGTLLL